MNLRDRTSSTLFPELLVGSEEIDFQRFKDLRASIPDALVFDEYKQQVRDLILGRNPQLAESDPQIERLVAEHFADSAPENLGTWVYYPWNSHLVHVLNEAEFAEVRTSRNLFKITPEEQALLSHKKVGIVGLSVGQSAALVLALQRSFGELRLADFDQLKLTNLNRIRAGLHQLGMNKIDVAAREIWETDPFLKLSLFEEGVTTENLEEFVLGNGPLDVIIDECDSIAIKLALRRIAQKNRIPVVMETSDRGMLDIERFDLHPDLPIFHGKLEGISSPEQMLLENPKELVLRIIDPAKASKRGAYSLTRMGTDIRTWPQLAEDVLLGGASAAKACRNILLGNSVKSGRHYIDIDEIIA